MLINHILVCIIDEWNSVCQDNNCCHAIVKKLVQLIGLHISQKINFGQH
jgi:hypothetical protein